MKKIRASVVTPMYNAEDTISGLLEALNKQTEMRFEMFLVDDGSGDKSLEIAKKFRLRFPLKIIKQNHSGPAVARNKGAKHAKSEIIVFIDSDCVPRKDFIEKILEPFKDPLIAGVQAETETYNKYSLIARYVSCEIYYRHESLKNSERIDHVSTCACAYRKKDFGKGFITKFRKADMEDIELSYRLDKENKKLVFQPAAVVGHYHPEGFWNFMRIQFSRGYWRVMGHKMHPEKMLSDSYMKNDIVIQGGISAVFLATFFISILISIFSFSSAIFALPGICFIILLFSNLPLGLYSLQYEKKMIVLAPFIASCRSIAGTAGFLKGMVFSFLKLKEFKKSEKSL